MKKILSISVISIIAAFLTGCVNPYAQFYRSTGALSSTPPPPDHQIQIHDTTDFKMDGDNLRRQNFRLIGVSSFISPRSVPDSMLTRQAAAVGAQVVLRSIKFSHNGEIAVPVTDVITRTPSQTFENGTVTSPNGSATYSGTSTSYYAPEYHTEIKRVPVSYNAFEASYWRRGPEPVLGVGTKPVPDSIRQARSDNRGAFVAFLIDGSPAFNAGILEGDTITALDDSLVTDSPTFHNLYLPLRGHRVILSVFRNGQILKIPVNLANPRTP